MSGTGRAHGLTTLPRACYAMYGTDIPYHAVSDCLSCATSYRSLPKDYPVPLCSGRTELCDQVPGPNKTTTHSYPSPASPNAPIPAKPSPQILKYPRVVSGLATALNLLENELLPCLVLTKWGVRLSILGHERRVGVSAVWVGGLQLYPLPQKPGIALHVLSVLKRRMVTAYCGMGYGGMGCVILTVCMVVWDECTNSAYGVMGCEIVT
eukprot:1865993-Rhodomonas_salina.1